MTKYNAKRTEVDGIVFASKKESVRYGELKLMVRLKIIRDLELQPKFLCEVNGQKICTYIADFAYFDVPTKQVVYEDVKGMKTAMYRLKKKLVKALFKVEIKEV